nr:IS110 family transposase [Paraflavitalea speifideiaquila]
MVKSTIEFDQVVAAGCGLDVHKNSVVASIGGQGIVEETRSFETFTASLEQLRHWLKQTGITHVAMESTSVYWKPVYNILEEDFEILLVNARHVKNVPGRKTDKADSRWLTKLLLSGLLSGSFIPPSDIREMRDLFRYKKKLTGQIAAEKNRLQKILEDANIKLGSVISDVFGKSGSAVIDAIIGGQTDPAVLTSLALGRVKASKDTLHKSLQGRITAHHRFMLKTIKKSIAQIQAVIADVDQAIDEHLQSHQLSVDLLQTIPGVGKDSAATIISEIGDNMEAFPSSHHLASWAGISPGNNESAGKKKAAE